MARNEPGSSAEHHALQESAGLLDESTRTLLSVSGDRAGDMLHGLVTNDVKHLSVGQGLYAFMLTPKGRPVAEMRLLRLEAAFWMDMPASCLESGLAHLRKYLPPIFAKFDETDTCRLGVVGPLASAAIDGWAGASVTEGLDPLESRPLDVGGKGHPPRAPRARRRPRLRPLRVGGGSGGRALRARGLRLGARGTGSRARGLGDPSRRARHSGLREGLQRREPGSGDRAGCEGDQLRQGLLYGPGGRGANPLQGPREPYSERLPARRPIHRPLGRPDPRCRPAPLRR